MLAFTSVGQMTMVASAPIEIERLADRLAKAVAMVESDPETQMGEPCLKGTRVPVYDIASLAAHVGVDETHRSYPFLSIEQIELAMLYVGAHPRREGPTRTVFPPANGTSRVVTVKRAGA